MNPAHAFSIFALVSDAEQAAVELAASHLSRSLSEAGEETFVCNPRFVASTDDIASVGPSPIVVTSFFAEMDRFEERWPVTEARLRALYGEMADHGWLIFLCTTFRSVALSGPGSEAAEARLLKIRRLNLLAAKLSQEFGLYVVDLDRNFADVGAQALQTDYRLGGSLAAELAAKAIALTIVGNGLDEVAPFELQDAAKALVAAHRPAAEALVDRPAKLVGSNVMAIGRGRRKQVAATRVDSLQHRQAYKLVSLFLKGQLSPKDAFDKAVGGVRRRGLGPSATLLATSVVQAVRGKS